MEQTEVLGDNLMKTYHTDFDLGQRFSKFLWLNGSLNSRKNALIWFMLLNMTFVLVYELVRWGGC